MLYSLLVYILELLEYITPMYTNCVLDYYNLSTNVVCEFLGIQSGVHVCEYCFAGSYLLAFGH